MKFKIHTGEIVEGEMLEIALKKVAEDWRKNAMEIRKGQYAFHITESEKDEILKNSLEFADLIERGEANSFTIWQRVNFELTGETIAFLPKLV